MGGENEEDVTDPPAEAETDDARESDEATRQAELLAFLHSVAMR